MVIKDRDFEIVAEGVKPDERKRFYIPKISIQKGITYHVYMNGVGQIILDPQVTIPASELWLFENKEALASVDRGMLEEGKVNRGSFAKYVRNAP
ncbi:hypothetical protein ACFLTS_01960 [Chloroflexota bacterium]